MDWADRPCIFVFGFKGGSKSQDQNKGIKGEHPWSSNWIHGTIDEPEIITKRRGKHRRNEIQNHEWKRLL